MSERAFRPVSLSIEYPQQLSRGHAVLKFLLGWAYAILPHGIILYFFNYLAILLSLVAFLAILFTGRYPRLLLDVIVGYHRWNLRLSAYFFMTDRYPPFSPSHDPDNPVNVQVDYPESMSRGHALLKFFLGWAYAGIPHVILLLFYGVAAFVVEIISFFSILFTGTYPEGFFRFVEGYYRWSLRLSMYLGFLRDEYPPFSGRP